MFKAGGWRLQCLRQEGGGEEKREERAELHSLGSQRSTPYWWHDSHNHATSKGQIFGCQGSGAPLPPPFSLLHRSQRNQDPCFGYEIDGNSKEKNQQITANHCKKNRSHLVWMAHGVGQSSPTFIQSMWWNFTRKWNKWKRALIKLW